MKHYQEGNQMTELVNELNSVNTEVKPTHITFNDGRKVAIPKLTVGKTLGLARVIAGDGFALWRKMQGLYTPVPKKDDFGNDVLDDEGNPVMDVKEVSNEEMFTFALDNIGDDLLPKILGIMFGMTAEEVEALDLTEAIELLTALAEYNDLKKTFLAVKKLVEKLVPQQTNEPIATPTV